MKCLSSLEILRNALWDHRLACLCFINSRETFTARHPKVTPHSGLRDLLPIKRLIQILPPFLSNEIPQPTEIPQRVLSSELSTPQSILIEDLVLFLISWSLEIFSFVSYTWHLPAPSEIERVGMSKGQGFWSQWGPGAMFFTEHIFLSLPSVLRGDLEHSLFPVNVGEKCYKTPSANHQVRNIDS